MKDKYYGRINFTFISMKIKKKDKYMRSVDEESCAVKRIEENVEIVLSHLVGRISCSKIVCLRLLWPRLQLENEFRPSG